MKEPIKVFISSKKEQLSFFNKKIQLKKPVQVFISYAREDRTYKEEILKCLKRLRRDKLIKAWDDELIISGREWNKKIKDEIKRAKIILLLVSPDALDSDYMVETEIKNALKRRKKGKAQVIPIIVRPCNWEEEDFAELQALPKDAKPISTWENKDEAYVDIAKGIKRAIENLPPQPTPKWLMAIGILLIAFIVFGIIPRTSETPNTNTIVINIDECSDCNLSKDECGDNTVHVTFGCPTMFFGFSLFPDEKENEKWHRDYFRKSERGKNASFKIIYESCDKSKRFGLIKKVISQ